MRRSAVLFVMLFAIFWQSVAMARVGSTVNALADAEHATLHWQEKAHHHHDDGSYHLDDSKESVHHMVTDNLSVPLALVVTSSHSFLPLGSAAPSGPHEPLVPHPALAGLFKPPRLRA
jgi:hypothetical protein